MFLDTGRKVKCDPPCTGFQLAPALRRTSTGRFCHDSKHAFPGVITGLTVIRARSLADVEVSNGYTHSIRD